MENIIVANKLCKSFKNGSETLNVLNNVCLEIAKGDFVSIMGPSGSGKSTLLYLLGSLDEPNAGDILVDGNSIIGLSDKLQSKLRRKKIGFIFQFYNLIPSLTVEENILLPLLLDRKKKSECKERLAELLELVGLSDRAKYTPRQLSGGQQQRVAIARALMADPDIIFADEPIGNLDSKTGITIMELLQKINVEKRKTIIMVTHAPETTKYGNRVIYIKDGIVTDMPVQ